DGKIIAFDTGEELRTDAFELIGPNRAERRVADRLEIAVEKIIGKGAHRKPGVTGMTPDRRALCDDHRGRDEIMRLATEATKMRPRVIECGRFVHDLAAMHQHLVGSENKGAWVARGRVQRLELRQSDGDRIWRDSLGEERYLDGRLIDMGGIDD